MVRPPDFSRQYVTSDYGRFSARVSPIRIERRREKVTSDYRLFSTRARSSSFRQESNNDAICTATCSGRRRVIRRRQRRSIWMMIRSLLYLLAQCLSPCRPPRLAACHLDLDDTEVASIEQLRIVEGGEAQHGARHGCGAGCELTKWPRKRSQSQLHFSL